MLTDEEFNKILRYTDILFKVVKVVLQKSYTTNAYNKLVEIKEQVFEVERALTPPQKLLYLQKINSKVNELLKVCETEGIIEVHLIDFLKLFHDYTKV